MTEASPPPEPACPVAGCSATPNAAGPPMKCAGYGSAEPRCMGNWLAIDPEDAGTYAEYLAHEGGTCAADCPYVIDHAARSHQAGQCDPETCAFAHPAAQFAVDDLVLATGYGSVRRPGVVRAVYVVPGYGVVYDVECLPGPRLSYDQKDLTAVPERPLAGQWWATAAGERVWVVSTDPQGLVCDVLVLVGGVLRPAGRRVLIGAYERQPGAES